MEVEFGGCFWFCGDVSVSLYADRDGDGMVEVHVDADSGVCYSVSFVLTAFLVWREDRATKVGGGGTSYA